VSVCVCVNALHIETCSPACIELMNSAHKSNTRSVWASSLAFLL